MSGGFFPGRQKFGTTFEVGASLRVGQLFAHRRAWRARPQRPPAAHAPPLRQQADGPTSDRRETMRAQSPTPMRGPALGQPYMPKPRLHALPPTYALPWDKSYKMYPAKEGTSQTPRSSASARRPSPLAPRPWGAGVLAQDLERHDHHRRQLATLPVGDHREYLYYALASGVQTPPLVRPAALERPLHGGDRQPTYDRESAAAKRVEDAHGVDARSGLLLAALLARPHRPLLPAPLLCVSALKGWR